MYLDFSKAMDDFSGLQPDQYDLDFPIEDPAAKAYDANGSTFSGLPMVTQNMVTMSETQRALPISSGAMQQLQVNAGQLQFPGRGQGFDIQQLGSVAQQHFPLSNLGTHASQLTYDAPGTSATPLIHNNVQQRLKGLQTPQSIASGVRPHSYETPSGKRPRSPDAPPLAIETSKVRKKRFEATIGPFYVKDSGGSNSEEVVKFYNLCKGSTGPDGDSILSFEDLRKLFNTAQNQDDDDDDDSKIAYLYRGFQKPIRVKDDAKTKGKWKCTLGCAWSHSDKGNWKRHERTHYPPAIWLCRHPDCSRKSPKARVSFRKDLVKRHSKSHHGEDLDDNEIEKCRTTVSDSQFPRECVFGNCMKTFSSFDERSSHIEAHLEREDRLNSGRIVRNPAPDSSRGHHIPVSEEKARPEYGQREDDSSQDGDHEEEPSEFGEEREDDDDDQDHYPDAGASAGGSSNIASSNFQVNKVYGTGGWAGTSDNSYEPGSGYGGYSTNFNFTEKRPWRVLSSLRLQLLPLSMAYGISKTPIVLKKIQLQAALALESTGTKQAQIIQLLRRELAAMVRSLTQFSPRSQISSPGMGMAVTDIVPSLVPIFQSTGRRIHIYQSQASLARFSDLKGVSRAQTFPQDSRQMAAKTKGGNLASTKKAFDHCASHIYRCISSPEFEDIKPKKRLPSRLIHIGSLARPLLHLDTTDDLPSEFRYCSVSHCWDGGSGVQLTHQNMSALQKSIPVESLPVIFQNAVKWSRERGLEYLWIDCLCIIQDSIEDWENEASKLSYIYASASSSILVTTSADVICAQPKKLVRAVQQSRLPKTEVQSEHYSFLFQPSTLALTSDMQDSGTSALPSPASTSEGEDDLCHNFIGAQKEKVRKSSHQISVSHCEGLQVHS